MALRNPFSANAAKDLPTLRRSINDAFNSLVQQGNSEIPNRNQVSTAADIPRRSRFGDIINVNVAFGTFALGLHMHDGTDWVRIVA